MNTPRDADPGSDGLSGLECGILHFFLPMTIPISLPISSSIPLLIEIICGVAHDRPGLVMVPVNDLANIQIYFTVFFTF